MYICMLVLSWNTGIVEGTISVILCTVVVCVVYSMRVAFVRVTVFCLCLKSLWIILTCVYICTM